MHFDEDLGPWCSDDYRPRSRYHSQMTVPVHKEKTEIKETHQTIHSILTAKKSELPKLRLNKAFFTITLPNKDETSSYQTQESKH
ncbi:unnamed protein product [Paramecium sonneborni]|uniref:Uncharacterized protein n=1 Tax=Paramecium sonneborni TaxID=65129 RepID=A0A8S1NGR7_9CILI|nr:unnamed protein product [Paramecium sonneborni]